MGWPGGTLGLPLPLPYPLLPTPKPFGQDLLLGWDFQISSLPRDSGPGGSTTCRARWGDRRTGWFGQRGDMRGAQSFWGAWIPGLVSPYLCLTSGINCAGSFLGLGVVWWNGPELLAGLASRE